MFSTLSHTFERFKSFGFAESRMLAIVATQHARKGKYKSEHNGMNQQCKQDSNKTGIV